MSLGLIVKTGRILTARLLMGEPIEGITHCAIGEGDATFTDPLNPPAPEIDQTALENEANGITIREYGFFGGNVQYVDGVDSDYAANGVYHPDTNPTGEVLTPGYLFEAKNIPDFNKTSDTRVELVGVIKI